EDHDADRALVRPVCGARGHLAHLRDLDELTIALDDDYIRVKPLDHLAAGRALAAAFASFTLERLCQRAGGRHLADAGRAFEQKRLRNPPRGERTTENPERAFLPENRGKSVHLRPREP